MDPLCDKTWHFVQCQFFLILSDIKSWPEHFWGFGLRVCKKIYSVGTNCGERKKKQKVKYLGKLLLKDIYYFGQLINAFATIWLTEKTKINEDFSRLIYVTQKSRHKFRKKKNALDYWTSTQKYYVLVHSSFEIMTQQKMNMKYYHDLPGSIQELFSRGFIWYILENWKKDSLIGEPIYREKNLSKFGQNRLAPSRSGVYHVHFFA